MKAIITTRFSDPKQMGGTSTEIQVEACEKYCRNQDWEIVGYDKVQAESAKATNIQRVARLLEFCQQHKGKADVLVVFKLDRFARDVSTHHYIKGKLVAMGMMLRSATEVIDETPIGRLTENMLAAIAQFDNEVKRERVNLSMRKLLVDGIWPWKAPCGYINQQTSRGKADIAIVDKHCNSAITNIFKKYASGITVTEIHKWLQPQGIRDFTGRKVKFSKQFVTKVLNNKFYAGILAPSSMSEEFEGKHCPLIDIQTFHKCQQRINPNNVPRLAINPTFPLRDNLSCDICGKKMTAAPIKGKTKSYLRYYCLNKECPNPKSKSINKTVVENDFFEFLKTIEPKPEKWERIKTKLVAKFNSEIATQEEKSKQIRLELSKLEKQKEKIQELAETEFYTPEEGKARLDKIKSKIVETKLELNQVHGEEIELDMLLAFADNFFRTLHLFWYNADISVKIQLQHVICPQGLRYSFPGFSNSKIGPLFQAINDLSDEKVNNGRPLHFGHLF